MSEKSSSNPSPRRAFRGRWLIWIVGSLLALLLILYFVATSSAFLKAFVLPRVARAMQAEVAAGDVSLSPFSQIVLRKLQVRTPGAEPILTADEALVRYSLSAILGGTIDLSEVSLASPTIQIVQEADGTSNLDPLLKAPGKPAAPATPGKPLQLAIRNVALKNATVRFTQKAKDGSVQFAELANVNIALDRIQNGQSGKLTLATDLKWETRWPATAKKANDLVQAKVTSNFDLGIDTQLKPQTVKGSSRVDLSAAQGTFHDWAGLSATLQADVTPTEIRQLGLQFEKGGQALGQISASGPLDLSKTEGRIQLAIQSIDRQVLSLVGARFGMDVGNSTLNSTNVVDLGQAGAFVGVAGRLTGRQISVRQNDQATPPLDLDFDYQLTVDLKQQSSVLQKLALAGRQEQRNLLAVSLDQPMHLSWGNAAGNLPDSTFRLAVNQLNLRNWEALLGTNLPSGRVDLQLNLEARRNGKQLTAKVAGDVQDFAARFGSNAVEQAEIKFSADGVLADFNLADVSQFQFELLQKNRSLARCGGSARYNLARGDIDAQADIDASVPGLLQQAPIPGLSASGGWAKIRANYSQKEGRHTANGTVGLADFSGGYGEYRFRDFQTVLDFGAELEGSQVHIQRATIMMGPTNLPPSRLEMSGDFGLTNQTGRLAFTIADLNQGVLRPLLAPSLGAMKLVSASVNAVGSAGYDPKGESVLKGEFALTNCVISDPQKQIPPSPLSAQLSVDASLRGPNAEVRRLLVTLLQGTNSAGRVDFTGRCNLSNYASQVNFKIADLNELALRPVLGPMLGQNQLVSVSVNGNGNAGYDPKADSSVTAELKVSNLVADDPLKSLPQTPLSADFQVDGSIREQILDLKQFSVAMSPTPRGQNQVRLQGRVDLKKTNATPSRLSLSAASLDLTPFYELFGGGNTNSSAAPKTKPDSKPGEPAPIQLPLERLTAEVKIDRLYLRDIAVTNLQSTANVQRGEVTLKPFQLTLNGAPVSVTGAVNLARPGFTYDLNLEAERIPIEPLANSFSPGAPGRYKGEVIARARIKGEGTTGANLQKNLTGQAALSLTNLQFEIVGPKIKRLLEPIALVLRVPELTATPLNWVNLKAEAGEGRIKVNELGVMSQAFSANGRGTIQIANVLTNSTLDIPVSLSLRRSLAEKANLVPADAPANADYLPLPAFAKLAGTAGDPKTEINKLAITGMLLRSASAIPKVGDKVGGVLRGVGGFLTGEKPALSGTNSVAGTNAPPKSATNKPPKLNPLDLLRLLPDKK